MPRNEYDPVSLALPVEEPSPHRRSISPVHARRSSYSTSRTSYNDTTTTLKDRILRNAEKLQRHLQWTYNKLTPLQRGVAIIAGLGALVLGILFLVYNERIFGWLAPYAQKWRDLRAGWMILWLLTFVVAFPPLVGYSSCVSAAGFVYGFPNGWFLAATATVIGSTASFLISRSLLRKTVERLVAADSRFAALALTVKHDGLKLLIMIRLCPLPFSLSNGAIATIPTVHWGAFALATAAASPKLLLHVFVGAKLAEIAEKGGSMDTKTKVISYASIVIGSIAGVASGWVIYRQTRARARQLEAERRTGLEGVVEPTADYADDPEIAPLPAVLRESEDDISLHTSHGSL